MPPDEDATDATTTCTFTANELDIPSWLFSGEPAAIECSRPVWDGVESDRCVWHAEQPDKPPNELATTVADSTLLGAQARETDLRGVPFPEEANLSGADLSEATLWRADLSGADLRDADLSGAYLAECSLADVTIARSTRIGAPGERLERLADEYGVSQPELYDRIARTNHELRTAYSDNGLISRARDARVRERRARRKEALHEPGWRGTAAWFGSLLSRVGTGYGVQLTWIAGMILALYLGSTLVYWWEGMAFDRAAYYSVVTLTTSPPDDPPLGIASVVAGFETFAGTAAIVFLGYVLGNRKQV